MAKRRPSTVNGFVIVDKPAGMTSHDVVAAVRNTFRERRVGHSGTLDPDATGVLVVGIGTATRLLRFIGTLSKSYVGEVVLGTATSTLDASGTVTGTYDMEGITVDQVREKAKAFTGAIEQLPPMVSAVRVDGKRLYKLAREDSDIEIERPPRAVEVYRFDVDETDAPHVFAIAVECSSGTYVRSLADDLGSALGGGAHLRALRRTAIGPFGADEAAALAAVRPEDVHGLDELVAHLDRIVAEDDVRREEVAHGKVLPCLESGASGDGPWAFFDAQGNLLAVYEAWRSGKMKPAVVLATPSDIAPEAAARDR